MAAVISVLLFLPLSYQLVSRVHVRVGTGMSDISRVSLEEHLGTVLRNARKSKVVSGCLGDQCCCLVLVCIVVNSLSLPSLPPSLPPLATEQEE